MEFIGSLRIDLRQASLICRQSSLSILAFCLFMFGTAGALVVWHFAGDGPAVFVWFSTPFLVLGGLVGFVCLKRTLRSRSWIMAFLPHGIAIKLTSFLRMERSEEVDAALLKFDDIRHIRSISEEIRLREGGRAGQR